MASPVGNLYAMLTAKTKGFDAKMRMSGRHVASLRAKLALAGGGLMRFGRRLLAIAGIAGFGYMIKRQMEAIDQTAKLADQMGVTTQGLIKLRHAANLTGAGAKSLDAGLATMAKRLGEAARGSGAAAPALEELGLRAKDLIKLAPDEAFYEIAGAMEKIELAAQRNAIAANLFSKANMGLLNTLSQGKAGLKNMGREAEQLGMTFSRSHAAMVEAANDAWLRVKMGMQSFFTWAAIEASVYVKIFSEDLVNGIKSADRQMGWFGTTIGKIADVVQTIKIAFLYLRTVVTGVIGGLVKGVAYVFRLIGKLPHQIGGGTARFPGGINIKMPSIRTGAGAFTEAAEFADAWADEIWAAADEDLMKAQKKLLGKTPSERAAMEWERVQQKFRPRAVPAVPGGEPAAGGRPQLAAAMAYQSQAAASAIARATSPQMRIARDQLKEAREQTDVLEEIRDKQEGQIAEIVGI